MKPLSIFTLSAAVLFTISTSQAGWLRAHDDHASIVLTVKDNKDRNKHEKNSPPAQEWQNKAQEAEGRFSVGTDAVDKQ
jgi:hypothetical protein